MFDIYYSHCHIKDDVVKEMWWVNKMVVIIEYSLTWFREKGSVNDLKQMVIDEYQNKSLQSE